MASVMAFMLMAQNQFIKKILEMASVMAFTAQNQFIKNFYGLTNSSKIQLRSCQISGKS